jgi:hypothetical protein
MVVFTANALDIEDDEDKINEITKNNMTTKVIDLFNIVKIFIHSILDTYD